MSATSTLDTIGRTLAKGVALSDSTLDRFVDYAIAGDAIVAYAAYTVRTLGTVATDGNGDKSLTSFATRVNVKRSLLSQRATAVGYIVAVGIDVDAETFGAARTLYGRGANVRDRLTGKGTDTGGILADIKAVKESGKRRAAFLALLDTLTAPGKGDGETIDRADAEDASTRDARPDDGTGSGKGMTRTEWIQALDALAASAVLLSDMSDAEHAHVSDTLAEISARVGERRTANTGSGRA